jgi:hypothetical protein
VEILPAGLIEGGPAVLNGGEEGESLDEPSRRLQQHTKTTQWVCEPQTERSAYELVHAERRELW